MALPGPEICKHRSGLGEKGKVALPDGGRTNLFLSLYIYIIMFLLLLFFFCGTRSQIIATAKL